MAGFVNTDEVSGDSYQFHIDTPNVVERIRHASKYARVLTMQLDGDELDAALWGIANYKKPLRNQK